MGPSRRVAFPPAPGLKGAGKGWDIHSGEGDRQQIRIKAHENNLRRGWTSIFAMEAVSLFMELSRVGLNPLDPGWEVGCVLETNAGKKGLWSRSMAQKMGPRVLAG